MMRKSMARRLRAMAMARGLRGGGGLRGRARGLRGRGRGLRGKAMARRLGGRMGARARR